MPRNRFVVFTRNIIKASYVVVSVISFSLLLFSCLFAEEEDKEFKKRCKTCHKEVLDKWDILKIRHYPYAKQKCESCHAVEHKKFTADLEKPCLICHDLALANVKRAHFSADLTGVNCFSCHYTHASDRKGLLKESVHSPFSSGMCDACHNITSAGKLVIEKDLKSTCLKCHSDIEKTQEKFVHPAYETLECADCHNPHTSSYKWLLKVPVTETCLGCHDEVQTKKHPYDVKPSPKIILDKNNKMWLTYTNKISCVSCHSAHSSRISFLLRDSLEEGRLCYKCHKPTD